MEEPEFVAELTGAGERRIELLRAVRVLTGLSLWHGKLLLDDLPAPVRDGNLRDLDDPVARLRAAGGQVTVRCRACGRDAPERGRLIDPAPCEVSAPGASSCPASGEPPQWPWDETGSA
ncbi:ribosomal protein L7/L12 [Kitasatospora sp. NPDC091207]|uniref:ribosomal protein L7/L12 n=1 Tax=Kitasatospora sp. NPDC091207 TaxID=3364083 RepID=UPI00380385C5